LPASCEAANYRACLQRQPTSAYRVSALDKQPKPHRSARTRLIIQLGSTALGNSYLKGFLDGTIYQGNLKNLCLPGLNCYSCPGAVGACPIGSLQNAFADPFQRISFYVIGFLVVIGALLGRAVCGFLCPFGLFQDLLGRSARRNLQSGRATQIDQQLRHLKTVILIVFVVLLPIAGLLLTGFGSPAFCKLICPSGTLMAGLPLIALNPQLRDVIGVLFSWKVALLILFTGLSFLIVRPFCRYVCPLGAIYGFFNRISLYRVAVDREKCIDCGICTRNCPMTAPIPANPASAECIRCGTCAAGCPEKAITCGFSKLTDTQKSLGKEDVTV
jgi:ferredoxin-type protein NapH